MTYITSKSESSVEIYSAVSINHRDVMISAHRCGINTIGNTAVYKEIKNVSKFEFFWALFIYVVNSQAVNYFPF